MNIVLQLQIKQTNHQTEMELLAFIIYIRLNNNIVIFFSDPSKQHGPKL
jgi:hypothetical protein